MAHPSAPGPWIEPIPGLRRQTQCVGASVMQALVVFEPNVDSAVHSHVHEQLVRVMAGEITFTVAGETLRLKAGDSLVLPSGVPHGATAGPNGATLLDTFTPLREDFLEQDRAARR